MTSCLDILYAHISSTIDCSREECVKALGDWTLTPIEVKGETVGAIMERGNEIHVAVTPSAHRVWARRGLARKHLEDGIKKYGFMITKASPVNQKGIEFIERLGFYPVGVDGLFIQYRIDHAKIH